MIVFAARVRLLRSGLAAVVVGLAACGGTSAPTAPSVSSVVVTGTYDLIGPPGNVATKDSPPVYPLRVADGGRYLEDQNDVPWRVQADAAWLMSSEATPAEVEQYLDTRSAQGFNSFYLMAAVHPDGFAAAPHAPNNRDGDPPFATPGDFSTAGATPESERYWQWIDWIIDESAKRNMVVMLAYTYLGFRGGNLGWFAEVQAQPSRESLRDWGRWLGARYKDRPNIIWFSFGDFAPPAGSDDSLRVIAIAEGIKEAGATQLFMAELNPPDEIPTENPDVASIVDMNSFYGYGPDGLGTTYVTANEAWTLTPTTPAWMQEGTYEYEDNTGHFSAESWEARRGRFWSVLAGGTAGDGFGSRDAWQWQNHPDSLHTPGAVESAHAFALFASLPWWDLRPSGDSAGSAGRDLVASGAGSWGEPDYITAAMTSGGEWLLAYVPNTEQGQRRFTIDMTALGGPTEARWFDPTTGALTTIGQGFANEGELEFVTPGSRDDGTDDWVLVLNSGQTPENRQDSDTSPA